MSRMRVAFVAAIVAGYVAVMEADSMPLLIGYLALVGVAGFGLGAVPARSRVRATTPPPVFATDELPLLLPSPRRRADSGTAYSAGDFAVYELQPGEFSVMRRSGDWGQPFKTSDDDLAKAVCDRWAEEFADVAVEERVSPLRGIPPIFTEEAAELIRATRALQPTALTPVDLWSFRH